MLVQSFMWAEKLKDEGARAEAQAAADKFISAMSAEPEVSLEHLYSARQGVPAVWPFCLLSATICLLMWSAAAVHAQYAFCLFSTPVLTDCCYAWKGL